MENKGLNNTEIRAMAQELFMRLRCNEAFRNESDDKLADMSFEAALAFSEAADNVLSSQN